MYYNDRETPLASKITGRCRSLDSDVSAQSWALISEKDHVTNNGRCLCTLKWRELVTGGEVRKGMIVIIIIME